MLPDIVVNFAGYLL